jgi:hypothetical protein
VAVVDADYLFNTIGRLHVHLNVAQAERDEARAQLQQLAMSAEVATEGEVEKKKGKK